jgi:hypothetical protein
MEVPSFISNELSDNCYGLLKKNVGHVRIEVSVIGILVTHIEITIICLNAKRSALLTATYITAYVKRL